MSFNKIGTRVQFTRRNGTVVQGKTKTKPFTIPRADGRTNGEWVSVQVDGETKLSKVRPSELTKI